MPRIHACRQPCVQQKLLCGTSKSDRAKRVFFFSYGRSMHPCNVVRPAFVLSHQVPSISPPEEFLRLERMMVYDPHSIMKHMTCVYAKLRSGIYIQGDVECHIISSTSHIGLYSLCS
jgi:hypothetical protein